jgi:hypothetical protein
MIHIKLTSVQIGGWWRARSAGSARRRRDFADAGRQLDRMPDGVFARYGLDAAAVGRLRERFAAWPRT